jgi:ABC-2 type transport system permease protein
MVVVVVSARFAVFAEGLQKRYGRLRPADRLAVAREHRPALLALGLLLLLRFSLLWVGIFLGLMVKSPEAVAAVQILVWPVLFLSNSFVAPETMPGWLGAISEWNPLSATVAATRELFGNPGWGGETWISRNSLLMAILWPMVIFAVFFPLSVRRYRHLSG